MSSENSVDQCGLTKGQLYLREYYKRHKAQMLAQNKLYRVRHLEEIRAYDRKRYKKRKKERAVYDKIYQQTHKRTLSAYQKIYRGEHKEEMQTYYKSLRIRYEHLAYRHAKLAKREGFKTLPMSKKQYTRFEKSSCYYCGSQREPFGVGLDRKDNRKGYTRGNVLPACWSCNVWRNDRHTEKETRNHFKPMRDAAKRKKNGKQ